MDIVRKIFKSYPEHIVERATGWRRGAADKIHRGLETAVIVGELTKCPVCGEDDCRLMVPFLKHGYKECTNCRHLFFTAVFEEQSLRSLYHSEPAFNYSASMESHNRRVNAVALPKVQFITESVNGDNGLWVDIGCGFGDILQCARDSGWRVLGCEPNDTEADFAEQLGIPVKRVFVTPENVSSIIGEATLVSLFTVLEHFAAPEALIGAIGASLASGSFLAIEVPRNPSMSLYAAMCFPDSVVRHVSPPYHLHCYSEQSMEITLGRHGFELAGVWRFGQDFFEMLSVMAQQREIPVNSWPEIGGILNPVQKILDESGLSDNLLVVARKI